MSVQPAGTTVSWATSDDTVLSVSNGTITAEGAGTATVTATAGELTATYRGVVTTPSISLSENAVEITVEGSKTLLTTTVPQDAEVTWASDDDEVATVQDGVIEGVAAGTATITATITVNGIEYNAECEVTVTA